MNVSIILSDATLHIAMREVHTEYPNEMYLQAKKCFKKYFESLSISNNSTHGGHPVALVTPKQEPLFISIEQYVTYVAWNQSNHDSIEPEIKQPPSATNENSIYIYIYI